MQYLSLVAAQTRGLMVMMVKKRGVMLVVQAVGPPLRQMVMGNIP